MRILGYYKNSRRINDSSYRLYSLILFVTNKCNSKCIGCLYSPKLNKKNNDLTLEEFQGLSQTVKTYHLQISGGEPFLRKELPEICQSFVQQGTKLITIPTNGLVPCKDAIRKILNYNCKLGVGISIDDTDGSIRGNHERALKTYKELKKKFGAYDNFGLQIQTRITNRNIMIIPNLLKLTKKVDSKVVHLLFPIRGKLKGIAPPSQKEYKNLYEELSGLDLSSNFNFWTTYQLLGNVQWPVSCIAGTRMAVVDSDGDVRICELTEPIGNIRNKHFNDIWKDEEFKGKECIGCTHGCFLVPSLFNHPVKSTYFLIKSGISFL